MSIKEIFEKYNTIAVIGMSTNPSKPSNNVPMFIKSQGYNIIPINPTAQEIGGMKCYQNLEDIEDKIEVLNVFRPSEACLPIIQSAIERRKMMGDIDVIWLQEGIFSEEGKKLAEENGIIFIQDMCMLKEYNRYY